MRIGIEHLEGRDHFVVPMVMITDGVHSGSNGPVFYSSQELRLSTPYWNGRPVVVYHPDLYTDGIAGNPNVFNRQKIGTVFNTRFDGKRLLADAWIDVGRVEVVDTRVLATIHNRQMMEVSTGLFFEFEDRPGTYNGKTYQYAARNLKPDHLAVLPDQIGACSIADGAGLCRNGLGEAALLAPAMVY